MEINYGFTSVKGDGKVFLRKENTILYLPNDYSYYFGIFQLNNFNQPIKIFDSIIQKNFDSINIGKNYFSIKKNNKSCEVLMDGNCLNLNYETAQNIDLDFRELYDFRIEGRFYEYSQEKNFHLIKCTQGNEFYWVVIEGDLELINQWTEKNYPFDKAREDNSKLWVYRLGKILGKARISWGKNKEEAISQLKNFHEIKKEEFENFDDLLNKSLENLKMNNRIFAGLPWFFQAWTRDELLSLKAYDSSFRKDLLLNYLQKLLPDGRLPNRMPHADLGSADGIGLLAFRIKQNISEFNADEKNEMLKFFEKSQRLIEKNYLKNGLIWNDANETWMDTNGREGFCIEIQALYANILELINLLGGKTEINSFISSVRKKFFYVDNLENDEIRPNIFLAYYFYHELFEKEVWENKFQKVIDECWLEWGGFSTISKNSDLYHSKDEGISDESYHNGNSWFFVNNIASLSLMNFPKFSEYSKRIYLASKFECLTSGLLAQSSEISDAEKISSKGCLNQAWSIATLKELHEKINQF